MPRFVRNFWIEGETEDGVRFGGGPRAKDGGFAVRIYMRQDGAVAGPIRITGESIGDRLRVWIEAEMDDASGTGRRIKALDGSNRHMIPGTIMFETER